MLLHGGERVGDLFHVVVIQTRHADTTAGNQVDTELFTQAINLRDAETGVTEHPTLLQQVVKITARQRHFQAVDQRLAHFQNTDAHAFYFIQPLGFQLRIPQYFRHHLRTKIRWAGVVTPYGGFELAEHATCGFAVFTHHRKTTDALTVQRENLRERVADKAGHARRRHRANGVSIVINACTKTLIGNVEERNQITLFGDVNHLIPLGWRQVRTCRVMTTRVQQHDALCRKSFQVVEHAGEIHAKTFGVEIRISVNLKTGTAKNGHVVFPGRIADPHLRIWEIKLQEISADFQRTRAPDGLNRSDALLQQSRMFCAE